MRRSFLPSRHSASYGETGSTTRPKPPPAYYYLYEGEQAANLMRALGKEPSPGRSPVDKVYRNWDIILLSLHDERDKDIQLVRWDTTATLGGREYNVDRRTVQSVKHTMWWEGSAGDAPFTYYESRLADPSRTGKPAARAVSASDEPSAAPAEEGSSFPWLPVIGGSALLLGIGGYIFYKRRAAA